MTISTVHWLKIKIGSVRAECRVKGFINLETLKFTKITLKVDLSNAIFFFGYFFVVWYFKKVIFIISLVWSGIFIN